MAVVANLRRSASLIVPHKWSGKKTGILAKGNACGGHVVSSLKSDPESLWHHLKLGGFCPSRVILYAKTSVGESKPPLAEAESLRHLSPGQTNARSTSVRAGLGTRS